MAERKSYSRETRLKAQRLYLAKGMSPAEISAELGISAQSVSNLAHKHGWAELRRRKESRALARAEDVAAAEVEEFLASVTPQAMEAAEKGFELARDVGGENAAKDFAMAMKGTQIAVQIARQGLGLDASGSQASARGASLTLVFGQPFAEASEPVNVTASVSDNTILDFAGDDLRNSGESADKAISASDSNELQNGASSAESHNEHANAQSRSA